MCQDERKIESTLQNTITWLDNLEAITGETAFLDAMPNNFGGRIELQQTLDEIRQARRQQQEEVANDC